MTLEFTPPVQANRFALSVGSFFKTYSTLGLAKMAYHYHSEAPWYFRAVDPNTTSQTARILELVNGKWFVLYEVKNPRGTAREHLPWYKKTSGGYYYGHKYPERFKATPMSAEEYADWRLKVEYELLAKMDPEEVMDRLDTVIG